MRGGVVNDFENFLKIFENSGKGHPRGRDTSVNIFLFFYFLYLFNIDPWTILLSKSRQSKYFHNQINRQSLESAPPDSSHVALLR